MGSKLNRICELAAEVGKATLLLAEKDERIQEATEFVEKQNEQLRITEESGAQLLESNNHFMKMNTDYRIACEQKDESIKILNKMLEARKKDMATLRRQLKEIQVRDQADISAKVDKKPAPKLVSKD